MASPVLVAKPASGNPELTTSAVVAKNENRLSYLDWTRGLAAAIMLQGHVFDSFANPEARKGGGFMLSQFLGGMPPAIFLFLTGITFAFLMHSREKQGWTARARVMACLRRAGYLLALAFAFRLQLWIFATYFSPGSSPWTDLFKVDVLNCMGVGLGIFSLMAVFSAWERARLSAALGFAIACASPWITQIDSTILTSALAPGLREYLVPSQNFFGFFPWAAFLAFGISVGSVVRAVPREKMAVCMQWLAIVGTALCAGMKALGDFLPAIYAKYDFWLNGPDMILMKAAVVLLLLPFAYIWTLQPAGEGWSWVRQLGTHSLLVYWLHIEVVYGWWLGTWKNNLTPSQCFFVAIALIALMVALSVVKERLPAWRKALMPGTGSVLERDPA